MNITHEFQISTDLYKFQTNKVQGKLQLTICKASSTNCSPFVTLPINIFLLQWMVLASEVGILPYF